MGMNRGVLSVGVGLGVLSSTTPIMTLPMLWIVCRQAPPAGTWGGALLTVVGTAVILMKI